MHLFMRKYITSKDYFNYLNYNTDTIAIYLKYFQYDYGETLLKRDSIVNENVSLYRGVIISDTLTIVILGEKIYKNELKKENKYRRKRKLKKIDKYSHYFIKERKT